MTIYLLFCYIVMGVGYGFAQLWNVFRGKNIVFTLTTLGKFIFAPVWIPIALFKLFTDSGYTSSCHTIKDEINRTPRSN